MSTNEFGPPTDRLGLVEPRADVDPDFLVHDGEARVLEPSWGAGVVPDAVDSGLSITWRSRPCVYVKDVGGRGKGKKGRDGTGEEGAGERGREGGRVEGGVRRTIRGSRRKHERLAFARA
jgi:hypothetical protein